MGDRHNDLAPVQPESIAKVAGGDTVPQRGDTTPSPEPLEGTAGLEQVTDAAPGGRDTVPFRGDSDSVPDAADLGAPLPDAAPATAALDGGAGQTLAEAVQSLERTPADGAEPDRGALIEAAAPAWDAIRPADALEDGRPPPRR
ncbi:hypothetical protein [Dactylosporangium sp. NPDC051541]|uniref:hypothetical protein n=1 Tax=Dactylosporangium sp. NPDC051541 TaxID=3363977 RepID=UPI00379D2434